MQRTKQRFIQPGHEFEGLIPDAEYKTSTYSKDIKHPSVTVQNMIRVVQEYNRQLAKIAPLLRGANDYETCQNIYDFVVNHYRYKDDHPNREEVRTPARAWADRFLGVDCDCMSVTVGSLLYLNNIPFLFRIAGYSQKNDWGRRFCGDYQHVYAVAIVNGRQVPIDTVIDDFDYELSTCRKEDYPFKVSSPTLGRLGDVNEYLQYAKDFNDEHGDEITGAVVDAEDPNASPEQKSEAKKKLGDHIKGALVYASIGASIGGTLGSIIPGVGTVIGGYIGAVAGALIYVGIQIFGTKAYEVKNPFCKNLPEDQARLCDGTLDYLRNKLGWNIVEDFYNLCVCWRDKGVVTGDGYKTGNGGTDNILRYNQFGYWYNGQWMGAAVDNGLGQFIKFGYYTLLQPGGQMVLDKMLKGDQNAIECARQHAKTFGYMAGVSAGIDETIKAGNCNNPDYRYFFSKEGICNNSALSFDNYNKVFQVMDQKFNGEWNKAIDALKTYLDDMRYQLRPQKDWVAKLVAPSLASVLGFTLAAKVI